MRIVERRSSIAAAAALLATLAPAARAHGCGDEGTAVAVLLGAVVVPSEVGFTVPTADPSVAKFVLGWSWQLPVTDSGSALPRHRIVGGVDLLPVAGGVSWRARAGYRYARSHVFGGVGVGADGAGANLSPEIGLRFMNDGSDHYIDPSLHLLARAEIAPESGHVRGATLLFGWSLF
ncbi:MAG TPA: hypothetical protein VIF57_11680 [Polyangia bacterium]|jgi:hypothetical protein